MVIRPFFPFLQWLGKKSGFFIGAKTLEDPHLRQPYRIGQIQKGVGLEEIQQHLARNGFFLERVAYPDPGQTLSMRRLSDEHPDRQYHLRVFSDGEVRGHYEYTPEDHPIQHLNEALFEKREEDFKGFLGKLLS